MDYRRLLLLSFASTTVLASAAHAQALLYSRNGAHSAAQYGSCVALLPDINADGVSDYAVGAPFEDYYGNGTRRGVVRVYSGKTDQVLRVLVGPGSQSEFGHSIAAIPDISNDGRPDLLIGAPSHSGNHSKQGAAFLFNSSTGAQLGAYYGDGANDFLGTSVANLGDIDNDGRDDWAIGTPFADVNGYVNCGRVRIYDGFSGALLQDWSPQLAGVMAGWSLAGLGDVSGDGNGDFAVGMPGYSEPIWNLTSCGIVYVVRGLGAAWYSSRGSESFEQFGWSLATLGDLTGDGKSEFAIGTPHFDGDGASRGRVRVLNGATSAEVFSLEGSGDGYKVGQAIAPAGDWNGDGVRDLAVSAPGVPLVTLGERGIVRIHSGVDGTSLGGFWGYEAGSDWGRSIACGRDLNGDGKCELLIGAPAEDANGVNAGKVRLYLGGVSSPTRYGMAKVNSLGCTPSIQFSGAPSLSLGDNFHITASDVLPSKAGMLFWGFTQVSNPFAGGTMLVGQPVVRTSVQNSGGAGVGGACDGAFDFHFSQAMMQQYALTPGVRLYAQYWYRDPGFTPPNSIGLTNAVRFDIAK